MKTFWNTIPIVICLCLFCVANVAAQETPMITVEHNNVSGGGFQSDVTITDDGMTIYSSGDVSGISKSSDGGLSYEMINRGLRSPKVASLVITPDNDQILYAGTGDKGGSGGFFRSTDAGATWVLTADGALAQFAGNHSSNSDPVPTGHPRSNGDLIVVDHGNQQHTYTDDIIIAGTYKNGVRIFTEGGNEEVSAVSTSGFVRSVAHDPSIPNKAYAAIYFHDDTLNGIYEIDYSTPTAASSTLMYQTPNPEGLTVLSSGHVYGAVGADGIVKYNGNRWTEVNTGIDTGNDLRQWTAVTGYVRANSDIVYIGVNNLGGTASGTNYSSIWRSTNGGSTWTALVDANLNVSDQIYGQSYDWWYRVDGFRQAGLGRTNSVVSSIEISQNTFPQFVSDDIIYVSGRGGIWKSDNGGDTWHPAVYNMQVTANTDVAVNPNNPAQVALANTDYVVMESSSAYTGDNVSRDRPNGSDSRAYDITFDVNSDEVIIGTGDRDSNEGGEVFIKTASTLGNPSGSGWTDTNLDALVDKRVRAISVGHHNGTISTNQTILAVVEQGHVYRHINGQWNNTGLSIGSTKRSNMIWPDATNSGHVYLLDLEKGLYRSDDGGQSWTDIWPGISFNNNDFFNTGYLTADDNDPTTLYVSIQGRSGSPIGTGFRVYRLTDAHTRIFGNPGTAGITDISFHSGNTSIKRPGPIVIGPDGYLWVTQQQNSPNSVEAGLFVMKNPKTDLSFDDVTTDAYRNIAIQPSGIDVSSDGHIYIAQNGTGVVKIQYKDSANLRVSESCMELYPDSESGLYVISGDLSLYNIEILDAQGNLYDTLDNSGTTLTIDSNTLPAGTYLIRVFHPNNNDLFVQRILKN